YSAVSSYYDADIMSPQSLEKGHLEIFSRRLDSYDFVIGAGGGRSIDAAKYASFLINKPWIALPTVLSHDGVVSSRAVMNDNGAKSSIQAKEPIAIIVDLDIIKNAPYRFLAAGVGDLLSNISAVEDWKIAEKNGREKFRPFIARLSRMAATSVIDSTDEIKGMEYGGIETVLWSLIASGFAMNLYGSSRPCSGSEHNFSHSLDAHLSALHGEQVALGTLISLYLQKKNWQRMRDIMLSFRLPVGAQEIGIDENALVDALYRARNIRDRFTVLNLYSLDKDDCRRILKEVEII
ncbi:MAG: iron-containing alcohol dehydrogenase, partial [Candidatus Aenigmarchaeota archaeon]|nr:iron-containing alcohol dehydrogenase [Candidatus Aenigmarchaeota archaeon]MDI6722358.1 iron-containing alcohol dehydrogenase [Candidatus Aenigmarchaeota archaeon]